MLRGVSATLLILWFSAAIVYGHLGRTSLSGVISDSSGKAIVGATVTLTSALMRFTRATVSNSSVVYSFPGFRKTVMPGVGLYIGISGVQNLTLQMGAFAEEVPVSAAGPLLRQDTAEIARSSKAKH